MWITKYCCDLQNTGTIYSEHTRLHSLKDARTHTLLRQLLSRCITLFFGRMITANNLTSYSSHKSSHKWICRHRKADLSKQKRVSTVCPNYACGSRFVVFLFVLFYGMFIHILQGYFTEATLGLYSLSGRTSSREISWSLEAAKFGFRLFQSLWKLTGASEAALSRRLSISERYNHYNIQSRGLEISRYHTARLPTA